MPPKAMASSQGIIPVYIHTGLITSESSSPRIGRYVNHALGEHRLRIGSLDYEGTNLWSYDFGGQILATLDCRRHATAEQLAMVFRNGSWQPVGRDPMEETFLALSCWHFEAVFLAAAGKQLLGGGASASTFWPLPMPGRLAFHQRTNAQASMPRMLDSNSAHRRAQVVSFMQTTGARTAGGHRHWWSFQNSPRVRCPSRNARTAEPFS